MSAEETQEPVGEPRPFIAVAHRPRRRRARRAGAFALGFVVGAALTYVLIVALAFASKSVFGS